MSSSKIVTGDYTIQSLNGNVNIIGNLVVSGAHTSVENTLISDNVVTLNSGQTGGGVSLNYVPVGGPAAGIEIDRGSLPKVSVVWNENAGAWQYTNDGTYFQPFGSGSGGGSSLANIAMATQANPVLITTTAPHNFVDGEYVTITNVNGMTQLNGNPYYANVQTATTFTLYSDSLLTTTVNGTGFTTYAGGGNVSGTTGLNAVHSDPHPALGGNLNIVGRTIYNSSVGTVLLMNTPNSGGTGLYVNNSQSTNQELVTNRKALTYGIIFG